jgi:hypothetical protein
VSETLMESPEISLTMSYKFTKRNWFAMEWWLEQQWTGFVQMNKNSNLDWAL